MNDYKRKFDSLIEFQTSGECRVLLYALRQFNLTFATAEDCYEYLYYKVYGGNHIECPNCEGVIERKTPGERVSSCADCRKSFSITTGTFFEKTRKIREWYKAIWLIECGVKINPYRLSQITGLAYSSAWQIFQRVSMVIDDNLGSGTELAPSKFFLDLLVEGVVARQQ